MSKRQRDDLLEDEAAQAAMELGSTLGRGLDVKLRVGISEPLGNYLVTIPVL